MIREYIYWKRINGKDGVLTNTLSNRSQVNSLAENGLLKYFFVFPVKYIRGDFHSAKFPLAIARYYLKTVDGKKRTVEQVEIDGGGPVPKKKNYNQLKEDCIKEFDRNYFLILMREHNNNISKVARVAGLNRKTVYSILDKIGINRNE